MCIGNDSFYPPNSMHALRMTTHKKKESTMRLDTDNTYKTYYVYKSVNCINLVCVCATSFFFVSLELCMEMRINYIDFNVLDMFCFINISVCEKQTENWHMRLFARIEIFHYKLHSAYRSNQSNRPITMSINCKLPKCWLTNDVVYLLFFFDWSVWDDTNKNILINIPIRWSMVAELNALSLHSIKMVHSKQNSLNLFQTRVNIVKSYSFNHETWMLLPNNLFH